MNGVDVSEVISAAAITLGGHHSYSEGRHKCTHTTYKSDKAV